MKYALKMLERIMLPGMLPEKAKFEVGIICQDVRNKLTITQDELKRTKFVTLPTGGMQWEVAKDRALNVEFTDAEVEIIAGALKKRSDDGELPTDPWAIKMYRDFVLSPKIVEKKKSK